jgi:hypothetical protein
MSKKWILLAAAGIASVGAVSWSVLGSNVETPDYQVTDKSGAIEIRQYNSMIVAEATVEGERDKAIERGFRIIAGYIFGNNLSSDKVAMTAPVTQQASERIAMTAPVTQQADGTSWHVRFVMPSNYTMATLPKPKSPEVVLIEVPAKRFVAIRFSGLAGQESLDQHKAQLQDFMAKRSLTATNTPQYAFYNAPWTLPFMRRNEIMIEIAG